MMNASMLHPDSRPAFSFAEQVHHGGLLRQRMSAAIHALLHVHKLLLTATPTHQNAVRHWGDALVPCRAWQRGQHSQTNTNKAKLIWLPATQSRRLNLNPVSA